MKSLVAGIARLRWNKTIKIILIAATVLMSSIFASSAWINSESGRQWVRGEIERALAKFIEGPVSVGQLTGNPFSHFTLQDIAVNDAVAIDLLTLHWDPSSLLSGHVEIIEIQLEGGSFFRLPALRQNVSEPSDLWTPSALTIHQAQASFSAKTGGEETPLVSYFLNLDNFADSPDAFSVQAQLETSEAYADDANLSLQWNKKTQVLDASINIHGASGGLISSLLGIEESGPIEIIVEGQGALSDWRGRTNASIGNDLVLNSNIVGNGMKALRFAGDVQFMDASIFAPILIEAGIAQYDLTLDYQQFPNIAVSASMIIEEHRLDLSGNADWQSQEFLREGLKYSLVTPRVLLHISESNSLNLALHSVAANGLVSGAFNRPHIEGSLSAARASYDTVNLQTIAANYTYQDRAAVPFAMDLTADNFSYLLGDRLFSSQTIATNIRIAPEQAEGRTIVYLDDFTSDWLLASGSIEVEDRDLRVGLDLSGTMELAGLSRALKREDIAGRLDFDVKGSDVFLGKSAELDLEATASAIVTNVELLDNALAADIAVKSGISFSSEQGLVIDQLSLKNSVFELSASGVIGADSQMNLLSDTHIFSLEKIWPDQALLAENLMIHARLFGDVASPSLSLDTAVARADFGAMILDGFDISATLDDAFSAPTGELMLGGNSPYGDLALNMEIDARDTSAIKFMNLGGNLSHVAISGRNLLYSADGFSGDISLLLRGQQSDFQRGSIAGRGEIKFILSAVGGNQSAAYNVALENVRLVEPSGVTSDIVSVTGGGNFNGGEAVESKGNLILNEVSRQSLFIETAHVEYSQVGVLSAVLRAKGHYYDPFDAEITIQGEVNASTASQDYRAQILGSYGKIAIESNEAISFKSKASGFTIDAPAIAVADGSFSLELDAGDVIAASLTFDNSSALLLNLIRPTTLKSGILSGKIELILSAQNEQMDINIDAHNLRSYNAIDDFDTPFGIGLRTQMNNGAVNGTVTIAEDNQVVGELHTTFSYIQNDGYQIDPAAPFMARLNWDGPIDNLWSMAQVTDHILTGRLTGDLAVSGTFEDPIFSGQVAMRQGDYHYLTTSTSLKNVRFDLAGDQDRLVLNEFEADDEAGGRVFADGAFDLTTTLNFPGQLRIRAQNLQVINLDNLDARGSGELVYERASGRSIISGEISIDSVQANLNQRVPKSVNTIAVTEINLPEDRVPAISISNILTKRATELAVDVDIPAKFFVRGRGLESEWRGKLRLRGTTAEPRLFDTLSLERGSFSFAGRQLALTSGQLHFRGEETIDPTIDVKAELSNATLRAEIKIGGRLSSPQVSITSVPNLPENEILANILFDTSLSNLGPFQIAQLADALSSLSNGGEGLNFISSTRRAVGLDTLSIASDSEQDNNTIISGGKYVSRDVYIEVSTATATGEFVTKVLYDLTRRLRAESTLSQQRGSSIKLKWFWDY